MSKTDVEYVFGPEWVQRARANSERRLREAERIILVLRYQLRLHDPKLPLTVDGEAWHEYEEQWRLERGLG